MVSRGIHKLNTAGKRYKKRWAGRFELGVSISQIETFLTLSIASLQHYLLQLLSPESESRHPLYSAYWWMFLQLHSHLQPDN